LENFDINGGSVGWWALAATPVSELSPQGFGEEAGRQRCKKQSYCTVKSIVGDTRLSEQ